MRDHYDIARLNPRPNPYAERLREQATIMVSPLYADYFLKEAQELGVSLETLINLYLADCVKNKRKIKWDEIA